jgi:bis(5'-nucleosidyl)-tetraphosphatase
MTDKSFGIIPIHGQGGERRFLLVHHQKGHWGFPKGHADPGESPSETALRELAEEAGVTACRLAEAPKFIERYTYINKRGVQIDKTVTFFIGLVDDPAVTVQPEEVRDHAWLTAEQALDRLTFHEARELLGRVMTHLNEQASA